MLSKIRIMYQFINLYLGVWLIKFSSADFLSIQNKGEYNILFRDVGSCNDSASGSRQLLFNYRLSKKSVNETVLIGNFTNYIPFNDDITIDFNYWKFHNERGYQSIPLKITLNRACSDVKLFFGKLWESFFINEKTNCPVLMGIHYVNNLNLDELMRNKGLLLPSQLLYGRYKTEYITKNKKTGKTVGCFYSITDFNANWKRSGN